MDAKQKLTPEDQSKVLNKVYQLLNELCDLTMQRTVIDGRINTILLDLKQGIPLVNNAICEQAGIGAAPTIDMEAVRKALENAGVAPTNGASQPNGEVKQGSELNE